MPIILFNSKAEIELVIPKGYDILSIEITQAINNIISRQGAG
jgi:flagellar basal body-associated protein FliL